MTEVTLTIDEGIFSGLRRSPEEFMRDLPLAAAIHWYQDGEISQEKAALLAGLDRADFISARAREGAEAFVVDFEDLQKEINEYDITAYLHDVVNQNSRNAKV